MTEICNRFMNVLQVLNCSLENNPNQGPSSLKVPGLNHSIMLMDTQEAREGIVKDFSARAQEILGLAMKWAPNATRAHLQEYFQRHSLLPHHAGLALLTESVLENACLNVQSASLNRQALDKIPSCVKRDTPRFITVLGLRNFYSGEVSGMIRALKINDMQATTKELKEKSAQQLMEEMRQACATNDEQAHCHLLWRMTSLLINMKGKTLNQTSSQQLFSKVLNQLLCYLFIFLFRRFSVVFNNVLCLNDFLKHFFLIHFFGSHRLL